MTPWVLRLLVLSVTAFVVRLAFPEVVGRFSLVGVLVTAEPWRLVTYMLLHADFWHLAFNMLALFFFGPRLEWRLGSGHFLGLYGSSGIVAALVSVIATPYAQIIGASGAIFGVLLGYARFWPRDMIYIWGIIPIEARWLVLIMAGLSLYGGVAGTASGIAHFAHLGGFAGGYLYFRLLERHRRPVRQPSVAAAARDHAADLERWRRIDRAGIHPVNRDEIDRLMIKIASSGVASLTPDERAFLDRFSAPVGGWHGPADG